MHHSSAIESPNKPLVYLYTFSYVKRQTLNFERIQERNIISI